MYVSNIKVLSLFIFCTGFFTVFAGDFTYYFIGTPAKNSVKPESAAFDGKNCCNAGRVSWKRAQKGVGVVINLKKETVLAEIEVITASPLAEKTEFCFFASMKLDWNKAYTIPDVTGKYREKGFHSKCVRTIWKAPAEGIKTKAVKILMYGENIWLCEIRLWSKKAEGGLELLNAVLPESVKGFVELMPGDKEIASGSSKNPKAWRLKGIKGRWLAVGNPNQANRKDKVTFCFNIMEYLSTGKVKKAILHYDQVPFGKKSLPEALNLVHFTKERIHLSDKDTISNNVELIMNYVIDNKVTGPVASNIDVTNLVNADLSRGFSSITFRIGSQSAEELGNTAGQANGVTVINDTVKLYIQPF